MTEFRPMRRKDRALSDEDARRVMKASHYAVLSTTGEDGRPYGVPVNVAIVDDVLYFHGTPQKSRKADNLKANPAVSLCFTACEERVPADYSTNYASAIVEGQAALVTDPAEIERALLAICAEHAAGMPLEKNMAYVRESGEFAAVWRVTIEHIAGKSRGWAAISAKL